MASDTKDPTYGSPEWYEIGSARPATGMPAAPEEPAEPMSLWASFKAGFLRSSMSKEDRDLFQRMDACIAALRPTAPQPSKPAAIVRADPDDLGTYIDWLSINYPVGTKLYALPSPTSSAPAEPGAYSCFKRATDPKNEFAACRQWCGDAKACPSTRAKALERVETVIAWLERGTINRGPGVGPDLEDWKTIAAALRLALASSETEQASTILSEWLS